MGRIVGIDYGMKRCGIAATDVLQIAVHGLTTVPKVELLEYIVAYATEEDVEKIVIGHPELIGGKQTPVVQSLEDFVAKLSKRLSEIEIVYHDESYSSQNASQILISSGTRQKKRREKGLLDKLSAVLILQDYLGHI